MLPVVAEVVRSGFVESRHHGSAVALGPGGTVLLSVGRPEDPVLSRSSLKPLQAVGALRAGARLTDLELIAVACASHSGEERHVGLVRRLLAGVQVPVEALQNTPGLPLHEESAWELLRAGGGPDRLHQNCSGKHAAMLAAAAANGWTAAGYLDPDHPVQQAIRATVEDLTGEPVTHTAVDGCGAPMLATSLTGLARAYGRLVTAPPGSPERLVADAMRAHPDVVGGTGRDVTALMRGVPGLLAKDGAEGVYAVGLADGTAVALKVEDGAGRARTPVLVAVLRRLGVDAPVLDQLAHTPVLGHGKPAGEVRAVLP